jgi:two-component system, OmpR family, sensor histidine kinase TctE
VARLRTALSQTETFIAEAAHHIRTPLSTVRAEAEIALRQTKSEETRKRLRNIIRGVEESARSASQLLEHAMVLYRSDQLEEVAVDLTEVARGVISAYAPTAEMKELSLELHAAKGALLVSGDRLLIECALRNLMDNAIKYSPAETCIDVTLTAQTGTAQAGWALLTITDQGRGLSGASTEELTVRFQRGANAGDVVGSGLGLTIVAEVATALGGHFTLAPNQTGGTCATLSLPLR